MKKSLKNLIAGAMFAALLVSSAAVAMGSAALPLGNSPEIPAARGDVRLRTTQNGNIEVKLRVTNLAPPGRIVAGADVFVLWIRGQSPEALAQNMGALKVDKKLSAKLTTSTALSSFDMFITCEQSQTVTLPDSLELLPFHYESK